MFAVIGTTYGAGDGASTFGLPDFSDNCCVSKSPNKALASTGGAETVTSTGNVSGNLGNTTISNSTMGSHSHGYPAAANSTAASSCAFNYRYGTQHQMGNVSMTNQGGGGAHAHPLTANFVGDATSVLQPYLTLLYIIKT